MQHFGYTIHKHTKFFPSTVLFSKGKESVTVEKAINTVDYLLTFISANFDTSINKYRTALSTFKAIKLILNNQTPHKMTKEMAKLSIEVVEEIANFTAKSDDEKMKNAERTMIAKILLDGFGGEQRG